MACSSIIERGSSSSSNSTSLAQRRNYDVFISFRGKDTRYNFTDILFGILQGKGIFAFRDDKNLKKGESIAPDLLLAIEGSQVYVVIFSKNYGSSTWCLRELEKILESAQVLGKRILPIFYDVDPSEVRHQKRSFDEAFNKHEERFKHDSQTVQRWREALTHVANLSGFDLRDKPQYVEIQKIVEEIINILGYKFSSLPMHLVGVQTPINMACSSIIQRGSSSRSNSSSLTQRKNYDVFISFRGEDTRNNITDLLFGALQEKHIFTFRDEKNLKKGESIAPELLLAIEGSQVYVVIFSKNYASSTWCLQELENIVESSKVFGKRILPIFYDVNPSEVRYQKRSFDEAFNKHEEWFKHDSQTVQRWREALTHVANISGFDLRDKPQYVEIQMIVEKIIDILGYKLSCLPKDLVGIHTPIKELQQVLELDYVDDVRVLGISDDLRRVYKRDGPIGAQKQILYQTQGGDHLQVFNVYDGANLIRRKLRRVRALIILDNVDHVEQLEKIGMNREWLGAGSRMIIISRDAHILKDYGVDAVFKEIFLT